MSKGNLFAFVILMAFPLIMLRVYQVKSIQVATLWTMLGGFMFLPVLTEIDLPLIPPLGKHSIPVVTALIGCWLIKKQRIAFFSNNGWLKFLVLLVFITPFITTELNGDRVILVGDILPGLGHHDALSSVLRQFLFIAPFFMGRRFFRTYEHHLLMFKVLVVAGLFYSALVLYEIRMSPQLHTMVYGYFPHNFGQQARQGGFRAVVFMGHGLWVSFFTVVVLISTLALWENKEKIKKLLPSMISRYVSPIGGNYYSPIILSYYFLIVLVLCKSIASLFYGLFAFYVIKKIKPKNQLRLATCLVILALSYPVISIFNFFPHEKISAVAKSLSPERAESLIFRFDNETVLLDHGRQRFFFGWGGWGRNRVYNEETGIDETVTDGRWIITFGSSGIFGFMAEFGLLAMAVFRANRACKLVKSRKELNLLAAHALLVGLIMVDQLPNASLAPWLWLLAGILLGRSEAVIAKNKRKPRFRLI